MNRDRARHLLTRIAVALVFIVFGTWELTNPGPWIAFLPPAAIALLGGKTAVLLHGAVMVAIGLAVLSGFYLRIFAVIAALMMLAIIGSLLYLTGYIDIVVRDSAIFLLACSLALDDTRYLCVVKKF